MNNTDSIPELSQMKDILDIQGNINTPWPMIIEKILLVLAGLLLVWFCIKGIKKLLQYLKYNRQELSPHKWALKELNKLKEGSEIDNEDFKSFYFLLTYIFKKYLQDRFEYNANDKTTTEIKMDFKKSFFIENESPQFIVNFLEKADLIKFGPGAGSKPIAIEDINWVINFVKKTKMDEGKPK